MKKKILNISLIIIGSFFIQLVLIIYKHYVGYVPIKSIDIFFGSLIIGTILTAFLMAILTWVDMRIVKMLNKILPWTKSISKRIVMEVIGFFILGIIAGVIFTLTIHFTKGYKNPLPTIFLSNALIAAIVNLFVVAILESLNIHDKNKEAQLKAKSLEQENIKMRFELLKKQLDPHFLFNSLNILSSLIRKDQEKSQDFIDVFSSVYRYTLDVIDKPVVTLREEIEFAKAYLYLQKLRFENAVIFELDLFEDNVNQYLPPLALQVLLENAFKHNIATNESPLNITIYATKKSNCLFVKNNIQYKFSMNTSRGLGLENLKHRYELISAELPEIKINKNEYIVKLPLLRAI